MVIRSTKSDQVPVHVAVVLDRSGSMAPIADDMVGGFNTFLDEQKAVPGDAVITVAQFDSQDPFELLTDAEDLRSIGGLDRRRYVPRGSTPLYDAIGAMIARLDQRRANEDVVVVIVTDGLENASREHTGDHIHRLIEERKKAGWTFVFLGADQDAYTSGRQLAVAPGSTSGWVASAAGSEAMFDSVSRATAGLRAKPSAARRRDVDNFFDGVKEAEQAGS